LSCAAEVIANFTGLLKASKNDDADALRALFIAAEELCVK